MLAKKPDGLWRFCVDYRRLNTVTHKDSFPLPNIHHTLSRLHGSCFVSSLDFQSGYWQIPLAEQDREKTAFGLPWGELLEFNVMPFGTTTAPPSYQRFMQFLLAGVPLNVAMVYIDDLVFDRVAKSGMKLKPSKCHLCEHELVFLGHLVTPMGIRPNPKRVSVLLDMQRPTTKAQLRSFLGLAVYFSHFIPQYSQCSACLYSMLHKTCSDKLEWTTECDNAFNNLKRASVSKRVWSVP